ncbi:hypothetical protein T05_2888 [Trichinella murrelli]|uniref:Uncharacterized protein n=1 Tax=Trichinella murrelli TaxID=144512 RepID=A0A0V0TAA1_9BILA|nr:hypothetical protein T05_2888 [Trichinella murrelli]
MYAYWTYVLLRLTFQLMIAKFNNIKQSANGYNHAILRLVKRCFQLLVETSTDFIRALRLCGGLGVFSLLELYATAKVSRALKMLWSPQSYYCHHHYCTLLALCTDITIDNECEMKDTFIGTISPFDLKQFLMVNEVLESKRAAVSFPVMGDEHFQLLTNLVVLKNPTTMSFDECASVLTDHFQPRWKLWSGRSSSAANRVLMTSSNLS